MNVPHINIVVAGACQLNCEHCAHEGMRAAFPDFQLELSQLETFLRVSKESGYVIESAEIHGIGEPLLWRHLKEGLLLLQDRSVIKVVQLVTNGILLESVADFVLPLVDRLRISVYPQVSHEVKAFIHRTAAQNPNKVEIITRNVFWRIPTSLEFFPVPTQCCCGMSLVGDSISVCSAPVWSAAAILHTDLKARWQDITVPVKTGWYDEYIRTRACLSGRMDLCTKCHDSIETSRRMPTVPHSQK